MATLGDVARLLDDPAYSLRQVLAMTLRAADDESAEQAVRLTGYKQSRGALVLREWAVTDVAAEKGRVGAHLTKNAAAEGRNDAERKALAAEALSKSEGYARLEQAERDAARDRDDAEAAVESAKEALRLGGTRLSIANNALNALAAVAHLARTESGLNGAAEPAEVASNP